MKIGLLVVLWAFLKIEVDILQSTQESDETDHATEYAEYKHLFNTFKAGQGNICTIHLWICCKYNSDDPWQEFEPSNADGARK